MSGWVIQNETLYPQGANPFDNDFFGYRQLDITLPDGHSAVYHGLIVRDSVHVAAIEDDETTYLVEQERPDIMPIGSIVIPTTWELPGGGICPGLTYEDSAQKELIEEVGIRASHLQCIGTLVATVLGTERDHIYLGTSLSAETSEDHHEPTEQSLKVITGKFGKLYGELLAGKHPVVGSTLGAMALIAAHIK